MATTVLSDLINPQVMADMISAKISKKIVVTPFAKVDTTLVGRAGDTVTVPQYSYIGDAADVAEGVACGVTTLQASTTSVAVKKAMKAVELTDEAVLSGYGDPAGEATNQLAKSIASKVDADAMDALYHAQLFYDDATNKISYNNIVEAIDVFDEEVNSEKVMFIAPAQVGTLRKDTNFISADKYKAGVMLNGEIGMIANCRIVPSKRVEKFSTFYKFHSGGSTIVSSGASSGQVNLEDVLPSLPTAKVGDKVSAVNTASYFCPIVKLNNDAETEDDAAALTVYMKKDTNVETERNTLARKTAISVDKHYTVALSNTAKVVLARIKA